MLVQTISLQEDQSVTLTIYIQEPSEEMKHVQVKPGLLICPGGGYQFVSDREAEVVALEYLKEGYQCFVLHYSLNENATYPKPLLDAEKALRLIHENHQDWYVNPNKVAVIGFSAGAHLATMLATKGTIRPNALIVGYPAYYPIPEINYDFPFPSVDKHTPEAFIFHTYMDGFVPVKNALFLAEQYHQNNIPFEIHVFRDGGHGLSLGNHLVSNEPDFRVDTHYHHWIKLSIEWLDRVLKPFQ